MQGKRSRGEPLILFSPQLNRTLMRMENQQILDNIGDEVIRQPPLWVKTHNQARDDNQLDNAFRVEPQGPRPQVFYRGNVNIVLPPLPYGHRFVVTSILMQMLTARGLFA